MPRLDDYDQFRGRHWETGTVANYYAYRGVSAPHTGRPYSEAVLLGASGGVLMGYFSFAYEGLDPMARILTRNTFDPLDTLLQRLGVVQHRRQTTNADKARANLIDTLEEGLPAIVWADMVSLPYNNLAAAEVGWLTYPILVYGYDEAAGVAWLADRAAAPLTVTTAELDAARARVKKLKFRLLTLDPPREEKLAEAVSAGIADCLKNYHEAPVKGYGRSFGLAAYHHWAELLTNPKARQSWAKVFPAGGKLYAGLTSAFHDIVLFGKDGPADRALYADFLDEAAQLLERPALGEAAGGFRRSAQAWEALSVALLPDEVPPFKEARELMLARQRLFLDRGSAALEEIRARDDRLAQIKAQVAADFPLSDPEVVALRESIAAQVMAVHDVEQEAVAALQAAMA